MKIEMMQQGSPEWHEARLGVVTASNCSQLLTTAPMTDLEANGPCGEPLKRGGGECSQPALSPGGRCKRHGGERDESMPRQRRIVTSESARPYLVRLATEWYLGRSLDEFQGTYWTERGKELEPHARNAFAFEQGVDPHQVGFVYKDESELIGCSPDWLMPGAGGEVKCPKPETHVGYLFGDRVCPAEHVPQVQMSLWVCREQADHWWFVSYAPELPLFTVRCEPDPAWQDALDEHMPRIIDRLMGMRDRLTQMQDSDHGQRPQ